MSTSCALPLISLRKVSNAAIDSKACSYSRDRALFATASWNASTGLAYLRSSYFDSSVVTACFVTGSMPILGKYAPNSSTNYSSFLKLYARDSRASYCFFSGVVLTPPAVISSESMKLTKPRTIVWTDQDGSHVSGW